MEQLERIEARLHGLAELGELVGALRGMAAARSREAVQALEGARSFRATIAEAIWRVAPLAPAGAPGLGIPAEGEAALIVIASEHGFVGGFNTRLIECALAARQPAERIILIGRRGDTVAAEHGQEADRAFPMTAHPAGATALARRVAADLQGLRAARLLHAVHRPGKPPEPLVRPVVPMPTPEPAQDPGTPPLHHYPPRSCSPGWNRNCCSPRSPRH